MNTSDAFEIVLSAARAQANGHEKCREILEACRVLELVFDLAMVARKRALKEGGDE